MIGSCCLLSLDTLVFDEAERGPVSHMPDQEHRIIKALLDGMIKQIMGNLTS